MKPFFNIAFFLLVTAVLSSCAGPRSAGDSGEAPVPEQPAVRVYDPTTYTYYWERDGRPVSSKYD